MNKQLPHFSEAVSEKLGNYVYRLIDPRNGQNFYVGKGKGNRVFAHVHGFDKSYGFELEGSTEDELSAKLDVIRAIRNAGLEVIHIVHRHEIPDNAIFEVEAALIDAFPGLTNDQGGHGSGDRGPMSIEQILDKYELPELEPEPPHKLVLININMIEDRSNRQKVLDQTRYAWRISQGRAEQADYVLAVVRGIIVGAFVAHEWLPATSKNFTELGKEAMPSRYGFRGSIAPEEVWEYYVGGRGKRIGNGEMRHVQNPVRYWRV